MAERHRPRCMHPGAEGGEHDHPPVADFIPESLDDDRLVGGQQTGGLLLLFQIGDEVRRCELVEAISVLQLRDGDTRVHCADLPGESADRLSRVEGPAQHVSVPERHSGSGIGGCGDHLHFVMGYLSDLPGRRAEQEGVSFPRFVDHLLVEFAYPAALWEGHPVEASVGDRARIGDSELPGSRSRTHRVGCTVPVEAGSQLGEEIGGVAAGEHVHRLVEHLTAQVRIGRCPSAHLVELRCRGVAGDGMSHQLLGQDVYRVGRDLGLLHLAVDHLLGQHRRH